MAEASDNGPDVEEDLETLDVDEAIACLNKALELQYRSVVQYTLSSGSLFGFEFQSLGDQFWQFARAELDDARKLVEKVTSFGGEPRSRLPTRAGPARQARRSNGSSSPRPRRSRRCARRSSRRDARAVQRRSST